MSIEALLLAGAPAARIARWTHEQSPEQTVSEKSIRTHWKQGHVTIDALNIEAPLLEPEDPALSETDVNLENLENLDLDLDLNDIALDINLPYEQRCATCRCPYRLKIEEWLSVGTSAASVAQWLSTNQPSVSVSEKSIRTHWNRGHVRLLPVDLVVHDIDYPALIASCRRRYYRSAIGVTHDQRLARFNYYGGRCWIQGPDCTEVATVMDHVKPVSKGGPHIPSNLRPACVTCNAQKHNHWPFSPRSS